MTSYKLKCIAIIAMTIDHIEKILGQPFLLLLFPGQYAMTAHIMDVLSWIGRLAFPIFAYLIAEGCRKTRSIPRYIGRLVIFAVITEPAFSLAFNAPMPVGEALSMLARQLLRFQLTSVFATLALGALAIYVFRLATEESSKFPKWLMPPVLILILFYAEYAGTDYSIFGVLLIFAFYMCRSHRAVTVTIILWSMALYLGYSSFWSVSTLIRTPLTYIIPCIFSCSSALLLYFYNGERGRPLKWTFYIYYPAHLTVLYGVAYLIVRPLFRAALGG